jgi:hypothetical protein
MDIVSILSLGAIGLGFLLAFLAYRLLATGQARERPVYIYMIFCLSLLGVGASLQYTDSRYKSAFEEKSREYDVLKAQHDNLKAQLAEAQASLRATNDTIGQTGTNLERMTAERNAATSATAAAN